MPEKPKLEQSVVIALLLMSKPILVTLPFVMLLLDYWPLKRVEYLFSLNAKQGCGPHSRTLRRLILEKIPFIGVAVLSGVVTVWVHKLAGAIQPLALLSLRDRLENAVVSYARYMGKMVWSTGLALPYPHPGHWPLDFVLVAAGVVSGQRPGQPGANRDGASALRGLAALRPEFGRGSQ
jgi:hypothetical protein